MNVSGSISGNADASRVVPGANQEIDELNTRSFQQRHLDNSGSLDIAKKALSLSTAAGYNKGMAKALLNIGFQELVQSLYDKAFITFNESLRLFTEMKEQAGIAHVHYNLGVLYLRLGDYENAMIEQEESLRLRRELDDLDGIASCRSQTAYINAQFGLTEKSMLDYDECIGIWRKIGNFAGIAGALMSLGNVKSGLNQLTAAKEHLTESLNIRKDLNEINGWLGSVNYLAEVYLKEGNVSEAQRLLNEGLSIALVQPHPFAPGICRLRTNMAKVYGQLNDRENAISELEKALELAIATRQQYQLHDIYFELANLYKSSRIFDKALAYYEKFHEHKQSVINLNAAAKLKNLEMLSKVEVREKEIEIHRLRNIELKERNKIIREERKRSDELLLNILPRQTARELKKNGTAKARLYKSTTVLFTDFVNFTTAAEKLGPEELVKRIHRYFCAFDEIVTKNNIEKIKTIGDAYMAAGGVPTANTTHPADAVTAAQEILNYIREQNDPLFQIRIGIHTGPVIAGIVGSKKFAFDIWGDTVNIASRMESSGEPARINVSGATYELIKDKFTCSYRGKIEAKRKGKIDMYYVEG